MDEVEQQPDEEAENSQGDVNMSLQEETQADAKFKAHEEDEKTPATVPQPRSVGAGNNPFAPKGMPENPTTRQPLVTKQNPQDDVKMSSGDEAKQHAEFQVVSDDDEVQARSTTPKAPVSNETKTQPASPSSPLTDRSHYSLRNEDESRDIEPVSHIISGKRDMSASWDEINNPTPQNKPYLHNTYADKISGQRNAANKSEPQKKKSAYLHNTYDKDDSGV